MSMIFELKAEPRGDLGKGASRRLRRAGQVPAILYGGGQEPQPLVLSHLDVLNQLKLLLNQHHIRIMSVRIEKQSSSAMLVDLMVKFPPNFHPEELLLIFNDIDYILSIEL